MKDVNTRFAELNEVSKTLLIPLSIRARESAQLKPVVRDPEAVRLWKQLDPSGTAEDGGPVSVQGILARTAVMDEQVARFLSEHPTGVVVNLGCGLDTRAYRVDNGQMQWFDMDLPEVAELRRALMVPNPRIRCIAGSVLEMDWTAQVPVTADTPVFLLAEGMLMYFTPDEIQKIFNILRAAFPQALLCTDVVHSSFVGRGVSSPFCWGIDRAQEVESFGVRLISAWATGDLLKDRQPLWLRLLNFLPSTRRRSQILLVRLNGEKGAQDGAEIR
ncbi:MAG: class I SAM-dependent methyltransferase [Hominenteromicrobium sp.]